MKLPSPIRTRPSRIEIIPLIDIMFFLLASFMMVSLQLDRTNNIKVTLPAVAKPAPDFEPDMIHIAVDRGGDVWVAKRRMELPELATMLNERCRVQTDVPVYISGDRDTRHGRMAAVLQTVRAAGPQKVAFLVDGGGAP